MNGLIAWPRTQVEDAAAPHADDRLRAHALGDGGAFVRRLSRQQFQCKAMGVSTCCGSAKALWVLEADRLTCVVG